MAIISLDGMNFHANHGCFGEEQIIGTNFVVDLKISADTSVSQVTDDIAATVNYQELYNCVPAEMAKPSHLLEHVASRLASAVLSEFPPVQWLSVKVSKMNPPLGGQLVSASVTLFKRR